MKNDKCNRFPRRHFGKALFCTLPDDRLCGTYAYTVAAADTLSIANLLDIHLTMVFTEITVCALVLLDLNTEYGELIEKTVKCAKRADETAEHTENEHAGNKNAD